VCGQLPSSVPTCRAHCAQTDLLTSPLFLNTQLFDSLGLGDVELASRAAEALAGCTCLQNIDASMASRLYDYLGGSGQPVQSDATAPSSKMLRSMLEQLGRLARVPELQPALIQGGAIVFLERIRGSHGARSEGFGQVHKDPCCALISLSISLLFIRGLRAVPGDAGAALAPPGGAAAGVGRLGVGSAPRHGRVWGGARATGDGNAAAHRALGL